MIHEEHQGSSPAIVYFHTDAVGSTRLVTDANRNVIFTDNYQPYGQDNQSTGSETYKFTGKPVSATTGFYYYYERWYDPTIGRFISRDPDPGSIVNPQSFNGYIYALNSPSNYVDLDGAAPVDTTALRLLVGFYHAITRPVTVDWSFLSPRWWGDWYVGGSSQHTIWSAGRPSYPGIRDENLVIAKLDRPNLRSSKPMQRVFHFVDGEGGHDPIPDSVGKINEGLFDYGSKASKVLLFAGLAISAWDVGSALAQGGIDSAFRVGLGEAGGWAGAWAGGEIGVAMGTALLPGVGTIIGGLGGAVIGGIFGQQGVDYLYSLAASASWNNYGIDPPMARNGPI
jgi:RHS repeat-associated protein